MKNAYLAFIALLSLAFIIVTPCVSLAGFDLFIKVAGVAGESVDDEHRDWIDGLAYSNAIMYDGNRGCFKDIEITKYYDKSSPILSLWAAQGRRIEEVRIEFCRSGGDRKRFLDILIKDAAITSISPGGSAAGAEARLLETVAFSFSRIQWTYTFFRQDGSAGGNVQEQVDNVIRCNGSAPH